MFRQTHSQRGFILIGLLVLLGITASIIYIQQTNRSNVQQQEREAKIITSLLAAHDALLARAVLDPNRPGSLPCPDADGDGIADLGYPHCTTYAGRLPWRTLDLDDPRDLSGERLWYILSPNFGDGNTAINTTSTTALTLNGQTDMVALIISPGGALDGQNRPSNDIADYLDDLNGASATSNRDGDAHFFSGPPGITFNDRIVALTRTTLLNAVTMRILGEVRYAATTAALAGKPLAEADTDGDGRPNSGASSGGFPYIDAAYADLPSTSWTISSPSQAPSGTPVPHKWYENLVNNEWFPLISYNRPLKSISLYGRTVTLP